MKKKLMLFVASFMVIFLINFFIPYLMPGDPFSYASGDSGVDNTVGYSEEQVEELRAYYGLDLPIGEQLINTIERYIQGDLGMSIHYKTTVNDVIFNRLPWTLYIMGTTLVISLILGALLALWSIRREQVGQIIYPVLSILEEVPTFLIGILLLFLVAAKGSAFPLSGGVTAFATYSSYTQWLQDVIWHSVLPITAMVLTTTPSFYFTARASFLSVVQEPYMLNARAKGIGEMQVRWRYIFVNGMAPVIACFFLLVGSSIGGTMLVENVFAYPGLGTVLYEAVSYRDYPLIQGIFLVSTVLVLCSLFLADVLNSLGRKGGANGKL